MKKSLPFLTLSFLLLVSFFANAQAFLWSAYVSGNKSYSETVKGITMSIAVTGSGFSSGNPAYNAGGSFLATSVDWPNKTTTVTYTITFSTPVNGVNFNIYDVDQNAGWDGTFKGVPQPVETYLWIAEGIDTNGKRVVQKGMVSLIR